MLTETKKWISSSDLGRSTYYVNFPGGPTIGWGFTPSHTFRSWPKPTSKSLLLFASSEGPDETVRLPIYINQKIFKGPNI